ncbi:hypothetical protein DWB61_17720 [Ancylomarina euxinus]|uniref:Uncharacterized protein n=1 Tax=Ancylomarina euxinus TaxID=2283627 RepID=A0A425XWB2_9BACT|nr:hypothetical protein [Ancylomarina euxinus]MCZ4696496.1 hypothetical protein [Ancylomarina euxinus]MUP16808.1 hypothetical protein [Ancylomarina euxinus]RRG18926.1 hypothetical protein DWB61_17720 [Ancylomarina euxinus]
MTENELINNLTLNENAYFYKKIKKGILSKNLIDTTFKEASSDKMGNYLLRVIKSKTKVNNKDVEYSICVFKYPKKPSFIDEELKDWEEVKLAYIVIVDFENYIAVSKRNISGTKELSKKIFPLDYNTISSLFIDEDTAFEKISMNNMNISDNAVRSKSVEAVDLKESISSLGLQTYIPSNLRVSNDDDKVSLSLGSSRINKFGKKSNIVFFISWSDNIIDKIENFKASENFLTSFATPLDFEKENSSLKPIAILLLLTKLYDEYEANRIESTKLIFEEYEKEIDVISILNNFSRLMEVKELVSDEGNSYFKILNPFVNDLSLSINPKSITLRSSKLKKLMIKLTDGTELSIIDFFNRTSSYIINFDRVELVYSHRKLFKDSRLLANTDAFLSVFKPSTDLNSVSSEKGSVLPTSTEFNAGSIFGFVEDKYLSSFKFFICDDLGKEWADHIGLDENNISFFHSKYKESKFSASAFQDIVGQAQKNLGNLSPADNQWEMKQKFWDRDYVLDKTTTQIHRIRKGSNSDDAIDYFKNLKAQPNLTKKVYLVINFISKLELTDGLQKLKNNETFKERNEVIQILWFISSLISSCNEVSAETYIICKP